MDDSCGMSNFSHDYLIEVSPTNNLLDSVNRVIPLNLYLHKLNCLQLKSIPHLW